MTAVFVPGTTSRFVPSEVPEADGRSPRTAVPVRPDDDVAPARPAERARPRPLFTEAAAPTPEPQGDVPDVPAAVEGYVLFRVGDTAFAVPIGEVREIVRAVRLELLPSAEVPLGHGVGLVDTRGRSIPVVDLRSDRAEEGDVLLPVWRHQVGLVVDRVTSVQSPRELALEHDEVPAALPSYARGVLRPVDGGTPVLLIALPDATELVLDAARDADQRLGQDVLSAGTPTPAPPPPSALPA